MTGFVWLGVSTAHAVHCDALSTTLASSPMPSRYWQRLLGPAPPGILVAQHDGDITAASFANLDDGRGFWRQLFTLLYPDLPLLLAVALSALAAAAVGLMAPAVTGELVNVIAGHLTSTAGSGAATGGAHTLAVMGLRALKMPAIKLLRLFALQGLCTWMHISLVGLLGERVAWRLRRAAYASVLAQDMVWFDAHRAGEVAARVMQDVAEFKHSFKQCITQGLKATATSVGGIAHLFRLNAPLTLTLAGSLPVIYLLLNAYGAYLRRLSARTRLVETEASSIVGEVGDCDAPPCCSADRRQVLNNVRTVRSFAAEPVEFDRFAKSTQKSLVSLGALAGQSIRAAGAASRCFECLNLRSTIPIRGGSPLDYVRGDLQFEDVHFTYPTRSQHPVLTGFNLTIPAGSTVALCGLSGGGKSTVAALLERFYDPDGGVVRVDGQDVRMLDPAALRRRIGYIHQEPTLFAGSIADNIRYGRPEATDAEVEEAARLAHADTFIRQFPRGYATQIGERGVTLSGGQKQRIAIARALLKDPEILILDEATSALDAQSEQAVQAALTQIMKGRTVLIIAHRLSTIEHADQIVVMGNVPGNILEQGTHKELLTRPHGAYAHLYGQASAGNI
ncbi:P-loop containing nucleoside triphosphate hydrolase protein [Syncephalis pseudoplumigaleata]|uniref:Mitochondrial potassium channel ATP-binding subunit n=1 Tax=Syncephalis pseudoplumigaleata TaxID=1712513 RepID=A0A4P9Z7C1_9FUNG|nr:P-loop containing nucleoside triphosphate hydrolase protein [Syncephalis pseudoplumigaleata]|eukprot:RKP27600.1 P-loop containing nucleoside triphosphate hydrolase protein [Syncephalis pseudoplumigaleata]